MASLKKLASQTVWYGLSNIAAKLLNQLLTPIITYMLHQPAAMVDYGNYSTIMTIISVLNVVYTYGMETAYFRFSSKYEDKKGLFRTIFTSIVVSTAILSAVLMLFTGPISQFVGIGDHPEYIGWCVLIMALDTLSAIPFAKLRQEDRPRKYAMVRIMGILVNIIITIYFIAYYPTQCAPTDTGWMHTWYANNTNVGFLLMANVMASLVTFLLLYKEWLTTSLGIDFNLWKKITAYSAPMVIVGLGGMVNETMDRIMLAKLSGKPADVAAIDVAIYNANYKIAIFITLFITAFRMSAEPFFFNQAKDKNAPQTYARVMKWFVIILCFAFLFTALYLDVWQYFIGATYRGGLGVVPILLAANVCLGIYYNLSVWYKITDKMHMGMYITFMGATITVLINVLFIPKFGMYACAWATLITYCSMMLMSYWLGQRHFAVPYALSRLGTYLGVMLLLFGIQYGIWHMIYNVWIHLASATLFMGVFLLVVAKLERSELQGMPVIGKFLKRG